MSGRHALILGGARSGKTAFGERMAMRSGDAPCYLATALTLDEEMRERVAAHQRLRPEQFATLEEPIELSRTVIEASMRHDVILVDCLTLWITNLLVGGHDVATHVDELVATLGQVTRSRVLLISNEVGLGIVPDNAMARSFRDLAGTAHQRVAEVCTDAFFIVAGLPLVLKGQLPEGEGSRPAAD